jgi:hypothetical protein
MTISAKVSGLKKLIAGDLKRHRRLGKDILDARPPLVVGWLDRRYTECRKGNCRCTRGEKHGPFLYARLQLGDKKVYRYVGKAEDASLVGAITRYGDFRKNLARWRQLYRQLDKEWVQLERALTQRLKK